MIAILLLGHQNNKKYFDYWEELNKYNDFLIKIHIDKKVNLKIKKYKNIDIKSFVNVSWASHSMIEATVLMLENILLEKKIEKIFLLSLDSILLQNKNSIFKFSKMYENYVTYEKNTSHKERSEKYYLFKNNKYSKHFFMRLLEKISIKLQFKINRNSIFDSSLSGDQWCMLSRNDAEKAIKIYKNELKYIYFTNCIDEFFFQNIIEKDKLVFRKEQKLIYTKWVNRNSPEFLNNIDLEVPKNQDYLFARKYKHCSY